MNESVEILKLQINKYRTLEKYAPKGSAAKRAAKITADTSELALVEMLKQANKRN